MSRVIFALFLCAVALVSYSECAPQMNSAEDKEFETRRDASLRHVIEEEGLTCENVKEFCSRGKNADDENDKAVALYCMIVLEPEVCEGAQL